MNSNRLMLLDDIMDLEDLLDFGEDDDIEGFLEDLDDFSEEDESDLSERRRPRRRTPRRTPRRSPIRGGNVGQRQASSTPALANAVKKNTEAIKKLDLKINKVDARVTLVRDEQKRQADLIRKDKIDRKKEMDDLKSKLQLFALLPALTGGSSGGTLGTLLPLLILGDLGGTGKGGGSDMNNLILVLALSGGLGNRPSA